MKITRIETIPIRVPLKPEFAIRSGRSGAHTVSPFLLVKVHTDEGLIGMKEGGKRLLVIPAHKAYGDRSPTPKIPPNSTLVFEVQLVKIIAQAASIGRGISGWIFVTEVVNSVPILGPSKYGSPN